MAKDWLDTLIANKEGCVSMAANMIGVHKCIIVFDNEGTYMMMFNPEIIKKAGLYDAEEDGVISAAVNGEENTLADKVDNGVINSDDVAALSKAIF